MTDTFHAFRAAILRELGNAPQVIEPGPLRRFATNGKPRDDAGFYRLFDDLRGGIFGCNRQFPGQVFTWSGFDRDRMTPAQRAALARQIEQATRERHAAQQQQWADNAKHIAKLWDQCLPVAAGDPVALYLAHRLKCEVRPLPACLRQHPALPYRVDGAIVGTWPAMVARLSAPDGRMLALHRTWLTHDGRKAPVPGAVKKLTPTAGPLAGACIRLAEPEVGRIGIAEGIETALAARCASGVPTAASYSAGALAAWQWPAGVRRIVVFADADTAGAEAADKLRQRAQAAGLLVNVMTPTTQGTDWCDVWANRETEVTP
ncbi:MAG: toprim domain-containing protein [Ideonella sp.]|nr:toprim domain-containing protein [Ideonella sp.]